jgi:hypothetical protein
MLSTDPNTAEKMKTFQEEALPYGAISLGAIRFDTAGGSPRSPASLRCFGDRSKTALVRELRRD